MTTWVQHEGKGTHLTIKYTSIFCLAEFRPAPGFCTCQTSKLMTLKKKIFFFFKRKKIQAELHSTVFLQVSWPAGTVFRPPGTETLAPRQMKIKKKRKKKSTYFHLQHENTENSSRKENYQSLLLPAKLR